MEAAATPKKSSYRSLIIIALFLLLLILVITWIYKHFFQFNNDLVHSYISSAASNYNNPAGTEKLIIEGVEAILRNRDQRQQVMEYAKSTGLDKEKVLVDAAIAQCKSFGYIQ